MSHFYVVFKIPGIPGIFSGIVMIFVITCHTPDFWRPKNWNFSVSGRRPQTNGLAETGIGSKNSGFRILESHKDGLTFFFCHSLPSSWSPDNKLRLACDDESGSAVSL
jgi:hypothetical protein